MGRAEATRLRDLTLHADATRSERGGLRLVVLAVTFIRFEVVRLPEIYGRRIVIQVLGDTEGA